MNSPNSEDQRILEVVKQLCNSLGLKGFCPDRLLWRDYLHDVYTNQKVRVNWYRGRSFGHMLSPDYPLIVNKTLVLREMMKGKLEPQEWEPLICSSLIFFKKYRWKRNARRLIALLPFFMVASPGLGAYLLFRFLGYEPLLRQVAGVGPILLVATLLSPIFPGAYLIKRFDRNLALNADRNAAVIIGKERFLLVLEKIDAVRESDVLEDNEDKWRGFVSLPMIGERIRNLQRTLA